MVVSFERPWTTPKGSELYCCSMKPANHVNYLRRQPFRPQQGVHLPAHALRLPGLLQRGRPSLPSLVLLQRTQGPTQHRRRPSGRCRRPAKSKDIRHITHPVPELAEAVADGPKRATAPTAGTIPRSRHRFRRIFRRLRKAGRLAERGSHGVHASSGDDYVFAPLLPFPSSGCGDGRPALCSEPQRR